MTADPDTDKPPSNWSLTLFSDVTIVQNFRRKTPNLERPKFPNKVTRFCEQKTRSKV